MALEFCNRGKETTSTTGTGTVDLDGAVTGFQAFSTEISSGNTTHYLIIDDPTSPTEWEVGEGTFTSATPDTLSRDTVFASSNAGAKVNFSAGLKTVISTPAADAFVLLDANNAWTGNNDFSAGTTTLGALAGTLSGTLAGSPTLSGNPNFTGSPQKDGNAIFPVAKSVQVFTSGGTWNRPSGVRSVVVEVVGAGGGGGSANSTSENGAGGGGGAGGYARKLLDVTSVSSSTITVGAGGSGGASGGTNNGSAGGNSSWADGTNTVTGSGGSGGISTTGANATTLGGAGGGASGGDINITGNPGGWGIFVTNDNYAHGGNGGSGYFGGGGRGGRAGTNGQEAGVDASANSGSGGGGGAADNGGTDVAGGAGAGGIVIVTEYA